MSELLLANESLIRITLFLAILVAMAAWEATAPRRQRTLSRLLRWSSNLGDRVLLHLSFPVLAVGFALQAEALRRSRDGARYVPTVPGLSSAAELSGRGTPAKAHYPCG